MIIDISVTEEKWHEALPGLEDFVRKIAHAVFEKLHTRAAEVSFCFVDDHFIRGLNKQYRGKDKPTNVLSFPLQEAEMLGDVVLALETIKTEAAEQQKTLEDHVGHLIVHGLLHLLGYDHENDSEAETMENLEIQILKAMDIKNPYESGNFMA